MMCQLENKLKDNTTQKNKAKTKSKKNTTISRSSSKVSFKNKINLVNIVKTKINFIKQHIQDISKLLSNYAK